MDSQAELIGEKRLTSYSKAFAVVLSEMTDEELESAARDYLWMAEQQDSLVGRETYALRRNQVVAECERRDRMDIVNRLRAEWRGGLS